LLYFAKQKLEGARKARRIPAMSPGWRGSFEKIVGKAQTGPAESVDCCSGQ